ncbi:lamin tail domain-containing protein [Natrinema sp. CBA1119]|uniref:lamin tail domain-containing protein n=1 Tax=Natrinema sp. CBA1119 TaxID=1608465 RepID=UPI00159BA68F|nr:lamin tail domain-containing protein [Natrinema sp. CBA1119]
MAAPESAPPRNGPPADEDPAAEDDESANRDDDSAGDDDENDENDAGPGDPAALALADYHILGEQASAEYLTLRNTGDGPLELSGWTIRDRRDGGRVGNSASPFEFPRGFTLEPGATVTISTGAGEPTAETLYWGYSGDFQIWHEEGDVVIVRDASGTVVLEQEIATDQPPEPPGDEDPDESAGNGSDEPTDPPDDDVPDEPTDPSGDETDDPTEPPTGEPTEPPSDDTADSPATSGGADGAEPNRTDGA